MNPSPDVSSLLADLATGLWRLRRRFLDPATAEPMDEMRRAHRDVEALWQRLMEETIEIQDHTGHPYDPSLSLRVAAFQPTAGLEKDCVLETLKPTVYHHQQRIQVGEVIVGIPERASKQSQ
jgi:hypothetical protein